ncbi:MAG: Transcription-repair-coupling factor [Eubacteriales bacterium SKADARSKE-1]|nr:Transcription-repair-coupling factor [Eubacteriales bacterium SKADARSKE-1]
MKFLKTILNDLTEYQRILKALSRSDVPFSVSGLSDVHKSNLVASLIDKKSSPILLISPSENISQKFCNDLNSMGISALIYPSRDFTFHDVAGQSNEYEHKRLHVLSSIIKGNVDVVISCIDAALQYTIPKESLSKNILKISSSQNISIEKVIGTLLISGYERYDQVEGPGQFSNRGGILDFFTPDTLMPTRLEFWGDEIDTISEFDILTQRRTKTIKSITITPAREVTITDVPALIEKIDKIIASLKKNKQSEKAILKLNQERETLKNSGNITSSDKFINLIYENKTTLFDYFEKNSLLFLSEPSAINDRLKAVSWQFKEDLQSYFEDGTLCPGLCKYSEDKVYFTDQINKFKTIYLDTFIHSNYEIAPIQKINISAKQLPTWNGSISLLCDDLKSIYTQNSSIVILAGTDKNAKCVCNDLNKENFKAEYIETLNEVLPGKIYVTFGALSSGFEYPSLRFSLITYAHFETTKSIKRKKKKNTQSLYSLSDLNVGDYVVHVSHGIGVFKGIQEVEVQGIKKDYIKIEYAKSDTLYVPVTQLDMVDKYIGPHENVKISLNRLGSNDWQKAKARVRLATQDIAKELIKLYSERMHTKGNAFMPDNELQRDFEAHFEYEETQDQLRCVAEIKKDMENIAPMDRLLCGDVGFGKTEVALRAAFKCVAESKQCAILVPTTILAWQHFQTALKRFEGFPIKIELLSRFRTPKQQKETLKHLKSGETDIVVGTHRLVQKDVEFRDLGLAVIDEEQRFGVKQKERFKALSKNVDVLTLSATPIPRTLNMAMSGIRDMSTLEEAPQNRYPVQTYVLEYDEVIINEAIRRELRRGGQVYYLHNNVGSISQLAAKLELQVPEARVAYGHGKMSEQELSDVWQMVINHEVDILVCTTIIETGVDVPNVNTLIIDNADRMGLSQLHQIRGRVGRSSRRAYAYFTFKKSKVLSEISQKRLSAIREFTEFGSGFKIAMRDLELRGAGNILSGAQHGHMADVGYDMYLKLLGEAIKLEKGEKIEKVELECLVDVQVPAYIPENYIKNINQRLDVYRKISDIRTVEDSQDVIDELIDRFGDVPNSVLGLIDIALIRNVAAASGINEIKQQNDKIFLLGEKISKELTLSLLDKFKTCVTLAGGTKPHISIKIDKNKTLIENIKSILSYRKEGVKS